MGYLVLYHEDIFNNVAPLSRLLRAEELFPHLVEELGYWVLEKLLEQEGIG